MEDAASADIDTIVDLMESELSSSSRKQDVSARAKFNAFLRKHVGKTLTFADLEAKDVSKEMVGKLLSYLFQDPDIHWQTSMSYLSSIKRQMRKMLYRIIDRVERPREASPALCSACSSIISENSAITSVHTEAVPPLSLRSPSTSKVWPKSLNSLKGKRLSDFIVQFVMEDLGTVQKTPGNRAQKDCTRAVEIVSYVADLSSIPPIPQSSQGSDRLTWVCARYCQGLGRIN